MLIPQEQLRFDFNGACFNLKSHQDRRVLGWVFNQFLYGEVTGIQCGHWLYHAPTLNAASFLAKQAGEEISHVRRVLRILSLLEEKPAPAYFLIRFLATGMMGGSWGEHVALEMALGEGLVLGVFYAMMDTIPHPDIHKILKTAVAEEEKHVEFGERECLQWIERYPQSRGLLLGLALIQVWSLQKLKRFVLKKLSDELGEAHEMTSHFDRFYSHILRTFELRVEKLGISEFPLSQYSKLAKVGTVSLIPFRMIRDRWKFRTPLLTEVYLQDPTLLSEFQTELLSSSKLE